MVALAMGRDIFFFSYSNKIKKGKENNGREILVDFKVV